MYITVQMQREHNLLALNLGLKYGIQVPNIGGDGKCIVARTNILGVHAPRGLPYRAPMYERRTYLLH